MRQAHRDARSTFGIPAAKLGLAYPIAGMQQVLKAVPPSFAKEIFFTARQFDTDEALAMNLINRVVEKGTLEEATREICAQIARNAPLTLRVAKHTHRQHDRTAGKLSTVPR